MTVARPLDTAPVVVHTVAAGSDTVPHLLDRFLDFVMVAGTLAHTFEKDALNMIHMALLAYSSCSC